MDVEGAGAGREGVVDHALARQEVDDIVFDELGRNSMELQYTGPLKPGRSDSGIWDCIIYDYSARRLVMTSLDIVYMDGTKIHYNSEEVKALIKKKE